MSFSSFYGGRQGASFVLKKQFDGLDIPQIDENSYVYKRKLCAIQEINNIKYFIYPWIEKNGSNYKNYHWDILYFDGNEKDIIQNGTTSRIVVDRLLAEGMRQCFEQGGETTNEVNYGEYVIINTIDGLNEYSNPDNGKVYRRGMNFDYNAQTNPLAGAEYVGQIVGPKGDCVSIDVKDAASVIAEGGEHGSYNLDNGLVPGKDSEGNFNDEIIYASVNFADEAGNLASAYIGFTFPYLVQDFISKTRSAYYTDNDTIPIGKNIGDRLDDNFNTAVRVDDETHPFYEKWSFDIPKGIKGDSLTDIEYYPTKIKSGVQLYEEVTFTIPASISTGNEVIDSFNRDEGWIKTENDLYTPFENGIKQKIRYKKYNYDNKENGEFVYQDLKDFNSALEDIKIETSAEGNAEGSGDQRIRYRCNTTDEYKKIGEPINYILDTYIVPKNSSIVSLRGHLLVYYSDPVRRNASPAPAGTQKFYSTRLDALVSGWTDMGDVKGERGNMNVISQYSSFENIPNYPPEVIMGSEEEPDYDYAGWFALFEKPDEEGYYLAVYDYINEEWLDAGSFTNDPSQMITIDNTSSTLQPGGFVVDVNTIRDGEPVFSKILQKLNNGGYSEYPIGPDLVRVGSFNNSNITNLEHQLLIGTDSERHITKEIITEDTLGNIYDTPRVKEIETIKFKKDNSNDDYYVLVKTSIKDIGAFVEDGGTLKLTLAPKIYDYNEVLKYHHGSDETKVSKETIYSYSNGQIDIIEGIS